ncbi:Os12g0472432 [Oryza sativa Japonica Group]|uniref:Os12g0472432 protein n=1 Tax=Oryza sativa subsp. japonica TaxID=39947 RepID=A0A0P0Y9Z9_ORYSJ|nr:Os12g0472432 [Oryza sativa Japonica Group]
MGSRGRHLSDLRHGGPSLLLATASLGRGQHKTSPRRRIRREKEEDTGSGGRGRSEKGRMQPRRHPSLLHHHRAGEMVVVVLPSLPSLEVPSPAIPPVADSSASPSLP